ncbi:MAG: hypothetical protein ABIP39_04840, partial [Polyangiaceae bacterium]
MEGMVCHERVEKVSGYGLATTSDGTPWLAYAAVLEDDENVITKTDLLLACSCGPSFRSAKTVATYLVLASLGPHGEGTIIHVEIPLGTATAFVPAASVSLRASGSALHILVQPGGSTTIQRFVVDTAGL